MFSAEHITWLVGCQPTISQNNGFRACRYDVKQSTINSKIPGVLTNEMWSALVFLDKSEVVLVPTFYYLPFSGTERLIEDHVAKITSFHAKLGYRWFYAGGLAEALKEFHDAKYTFILGKHVSNEEDLQLKWRQHDLNRKQRLQYNEVLITDINPTFNKVLQTISKKP